MTVADRGADMPVAVDLARMTDLVQFERRAEQRWTPALRTYVRRQAGRGRTVAANLRAWQRWHLRTRVLADVHDCDTSTTVLGTRIAAPVLVAPCGLQSAIHPEAELATAAGARTEGTIFTLSGATALPIADVRAVGAPTWFQLYWGPDRGRVRALVEEAAGAGCSALCLTVDLPVRPLVHQDVVAAVRAIEQAPPRYMAPRGLRLAPGPSDDHDATLTWKDLEWLRSVCPMPLVLKGLATHEDARAAVAEGVDAVVVSNHGGRAVDNGLGTLDVLPEVVAAVEGRVPVLVDGGVRHGSDVLVALALGARAVLVGRPVLWGLAVGGADGVARVLQLLREQLRTTMAMVGAATVGDVDATRVVHDAAVRACRGGCGR